MPIADAHKLFVKLLSRAGLGKEAKLNKRNLTFTISNFSIYTIFVITFGQYNWLIKDM